MHPKLLTISLLAGTALATFPLAVNAGATSGLGQDTLVTAQLTPAPRGAAPDEEDSSDPRRRRQQRPGAAEDEDGQRPPGRDRGRSPDAAQPAEPGGRRPSLPGGAQVPGAAPTESPRRPTTRSQEQPADSPRPGRDPRAPSPAEPAAPSPRSVTPDAPPRGPDTPQAPRRIPSAPEAPSPRLGAPPTAPRTQEPTERTAPPSQRPPAATAPAAPPETAPSAPVTRPPAGAAPRTTDEPAAPRQPRRGEQPPERRPPRDDAPRTPGERPPAPAVTPPPATAPRTQPAPTPETAPQTAPVPRTAPQPAPTPQTPPSPQPAPAPQAAPTPRTVPTPETAPAQQPAAPPQQPSRIAPAQEPAQAPAPAPLPGAAGRVAPGADRFAPGIAGGRDVRIEELRSLRRERVEEGGRRVIIEEPGNRIIVRENGREFIRHDETERFRRSYGDADVRVERRGAEQVTVVRRPNGIEILTIRDPEGNLVRRVRRDPRGVETVLIENEFAGRPRRRTIIEEVIELPPPRLTIPREKYVVEVERATQEDLYEAFSAPPVERVERRYSLDEIRQSRSLRERVRRVDVDTVTFDFGSWLLSENQIGALTGVAEAIRRTLENNPNEIYLIEGHTDAVGAEVDNLTLSDRRAETVATILAERFGIPAENLTTQGYGEQYLKIATEAPERENRRVTVRRITPLLQQEAAR